MKKYRSRVLTFLLASAFSAAALGGAVAFSGVSARADGITYTPSRVFTAGSSASVGADEDDEAAMAFTIPESGSVSFRRDLALKWFDTTGEDGAAEANYLSMRFALKDTDFSRLTITFETAPATALKDNKATNTIAFENTDGVLSVKVNDDETGTALAEEGIISETTDDITLTLGETDGATEAEEGEFFVFLNGIRVGTFENIGANFAEYFSASATTPMVPFTFAAEFPEDGAADPDTVILFKELNGQEFALTDGSITDTAKPVLVVNDVVTSFALGMPYSLDYQVIDVLDTSVSNTMEYYQYNPTDEEATYETLTTSVYFFDTVYTTGEGDSAVTTSVYAEEGMEFVSVRFTLEDENFTDDNAAVYYLAWYATEAVQPSNPTHDADLTYVKVDRNAVGPAYTVIENDPDTRTTTVLPEAEALFADYQAAVEEAAEGVRAGSNSYVYLPSLRGIITDDDTGYSNLEFDIYYKTASSSSASSSTGLDSDELRLAVSTAGMYEFKVVARDKVGNEMFVYVDGQKTYLTSDNIWDIEEIPSFTFSVYNAGLSVEEDDDSMPDTGFLDVTYTLSDFTVTGISGYGETYGLYYFDAVEFQNRYPAFTTGSLINISFETLKEMEQADLSEDKIDRLYDDPIEYFAALYAQALCDHLGLDISGEDLLAKDADGNSILRRIEEYDSTIDEDDFPEEWENSDNKYHWDASAQSFRPQEQGVYLIFAVFTDSELFGDYAAAYKAVSVDADIDSIPGETQWLQNNIASIILFAIAGVMLIIIIILLLVKPSDESLEDIDAEEDGKGKKRKKQKKEKKEKKNEKGDSDTKE